MIVKNELFYYSIIVVVFLFLLSLAIIEPGTPANFVENSSFLYSKEHSYLLNSNDTSEIGITLIPQNLENIGQQISIKIDSISLDFRSLQIPENTIDICITSVEIKTAGSSKIKYHFIENQRLYETPICGLLKSPSFVYDRYGKLLLGDKDNKPCMDCSKLQINDGQRIYYIEHDPLRVDSLFENDPFMFPFDDFRITIGALMTFDFLDGSGNPISSVSSMPNIYLSIDGGNQWFTQPDNYLKENFWSGFNHPLATGEQYFALLTNPTVDPISLRFSRPLLSKIALLVFTVTFFLSITLVVLKKNIKTLVDVGIAILVGIFGARTFLVPDYLKTTGLIDLLFLILILFYFFSLIFIIVISWRNEYILSNKSKRLQSHHREIDPKKKNHNF